MKITKDTIIADVMEEYPEWVEIFMEYWLWCVWCWASSFETIEEWASAHMMDEDAINKLISDLNEMASEINSK